MKNQWIHIVLAVVIGLSGAARLRAAEDRAVADWGTLRGVVMGQDVEVRAVGHPMLRGKVTGFSEERVQLRSGNQAVTIDRAEVEQVGVRRKSKRLRNALLFGAIGVGVAAAIGLGVVAGTGGSDDVAGVVTLPIALGGAAGAGIGAAMPDGYRLVYRR